jgi:uncharacterized glyoxalase superfamily protein PhnB
MRRAFISGLSISRTLPRWRRGKARSSWRRVEVANVKALFEEFEARGVEFPQRLQRQAWGGLDFHVEDPDGNRISFVAYDAPGG